MDKNVIDARIVELIKAYGSQRAASLAAGLSPGYLAVRKHEGLRLGERALRGLARAAGMSEAEFLAGESPVRSLPHPARASSGIERACVDSDPEVSRLRAALAAREAEVRAEFRARTSGQTPPEQP